MPDAPGNDSIAELSAMISTRRRFVAQSAAVMTSAAIALHLAAERVAAQATPVAVDPARLQQLTDLSQTLCGGGNLDAGRATKLYQIIAADADLTAGLDELLKSPPVAGQSLGSDQAQQTAQVILIFWYADVFDGDPLPDRGTAYYQLTSWQAMYTFSWAVCHIYGGWADEPADGPIVPAN